jgi:hypothetical protein
MDSGKANPKTLKQSKGYKYFLGAHPIVQVLKYYNEGSSIY